MSILLNKKELDKLWEEYEKNDPLQKEEWGNIVAKDQLKKVVELLKKNKGDGLGHDWGTRQGAPVEVFLLDPLVWQSMLKDME